MSKNREARQWLCSGWAGLGPLVLNLFPLPCAFGGGGGVGSGQAQSSFAAKSALNRAGVEAQFGCLSLWCAFLPPTPPLQCLLLSLSAGFGDLQMVKYLLKEACVALPTEPEDDHPAVAAACAGHRDVAKELLDSFPGEWRLPSRLLPGLPGFSWALIAGVPWSPARVTCASVAGRFLEFCAGSL